MLCWRLPGEDDDRKNKRRFLPRPPGDVDNIEVGGAGGVIVECLAPPWVLCVSTLEALCETLFIFPTPDQFHSVISLAQDPVPHRCMRMYVCTFIHTHIEREAHTHIHMHTHSTSLCICTCTYTWVCGGGGVCILWVGWVDGMAGGLFEAV